MNVKTTKANQTRAQKSSRGNEQKLLKRRTKMGVIEGNFLPPRSDWRLKENKVKQFATSFVR